MGPVIHPLAKKSTGWTRLGPEEAEKAYSDLMLRQLPQAQLTSTWMARSPGDFPTLAEAFGFYIRELHRVYSSILDEMKKSDRWTVLLVRSTYHSKADDPDSVLVEETNDMERVQIKGYQLDPRIFPFPWRDNSIERPWKPWGWEISPLPEDEDETHYFFDQERNKLMIGRCNEPSQIEFYGLEPMLPQNLNLFYEK